MATKIMAQQTLRIGWGVFSPSWSVEELDGCIIVWDRNGQALTYVYFEDDPRRRSIAKLLTRDDARQIAANIAKLPSLVG
jgi:hypothetical protein